MLQKVRVSKKKAKHKVEGRLHVMQLAVGIVWLSRIANLPHSPFSPFHSRCLSLYAPLRVLTRSSAPSVRSLLSLRVKQAGSNLEKHLRLCWCMLRRIQKSQA